MATTNEDNNTIDLKNRCLLVSDSNEIQTQMDSKQLPYNTLAEMAENALFRKYLNMDKYLTVQEYEANKRQLESVKNDLDMPNTESANPKLRAVEGQVILLNAANIPEDVSPIDHALAYWDISSEYQLMPIPDSMLRGVLFKSGDTLEVHRPGNRTIQLTDETMPPHMHHNAVTTGGDFITMRKGNDTTYAKKGNATYDMFYSDSLDIGLDKNELDGTVDYFEVASAGENVVYHNNIPPYTSFYGFVVVRK